MSRNIDDVWLKESQEHLKSLIEDDIDSAFDYWMQLYCKALVESKFDVCLSLTQEPYGFLINFPLGKNFFQNGTKTLISEDFDEAIKMLKYLVNNGMKYQVDASLKLTYALVNILIGNYYFNDFFDNEKALPYFECAKSLAPEEGYPYAALGNFYYEKGTFVEASEFFAKAIKYSPYQPYGYVGMGLLAEERQKLDEAQDWFKKALNTLDKEKIIIDNLYNFIVSLNASFYIQLAQALEEKNDLGQALSALNQAIDVVKYNSANERKAYRIKADILERSNMFAEAVEAYHGAGKKYYWNREWDTARDQFYKVYKMDENYIANYWYFADTLYFQSYNQEYPFVNEHIIKESLKIWNEGFLLQTPQIDWPYISRANIIQQMAKIKKDKKSVYWEAVAFTEWALIFNNEKPRWWSVLIGLYSDLELESMALQTINLLPEESKDDLYILDEEARVLSNVGRFNMALDCIEKRLNKEEKGSALAIKAYNLFWQKKYGDSLDLYKEAIFQEESLAKAPWVRNIQAVCYRNLSLKQKALDKFNEIWKEYEDNKELYEKYNDYGSFDWMAFFLDGLRPEENILDYAIKFSVFKINDEYLNQFSTCDAKLLLGLAYLKKSEIGEGRKYLLDGLEDLNHKRDIDSLDLLIMELEQQMQERLEKAKIDKRQKKEIRAKNNEVRQVLEEIRKKSIKRISDFDYLSLQESESHKRIDTGVREIEKDINRFKTEGKVEGYAWVGLNLSLVRWCEVGKKWSSKLYNAYQELFKCYDIFPAVEKRLESTINLIRDKGNEQIKEEKLEDALNLFEQAVELMELSSIKSQENVDLLSRVGFMYFKMKRSNQTFKTWTKAIEIYKGIEIHDIQIGERNVGQFIGNVCLSLLKKPEDCWLLRETIDKYINDLPSNDSHIDDFKEIISTLFDFFNQQFQLKSEMTSSNNMISVVTPIAVEMGVNLTPHDEENWDFIKEYVPEMRERIIKSMGVEIPGVRVRTNESDLSSNAYNILLNEIPIDSGEVYLNMVYCLESWNKIQREVPDILWTELKEVSDPLIGITGFWIQDEYLEDLNKGSIKFWEDPKFFIIRHLEAVLINNLENFLGLQEVEKILDDFKFEDEDNLSLIEDVVHNQESVIILTQILRNLVKEKFPIYNIKEILHVIKKINICDENIEEIIRIIRLQLKERLPGNKEIVRYINPIKEFEELLLDFIGNDKKYITFPIPPESMVDILSIIREHVERDNKNQVLIIERANLRSLAQDIVDIEFPNLIVISKEELM